MESTKFNSKVEKGLTLPQIIGISLGVFVVCLAIVLGLSLAVSKKTKWTPPAKRNGWAPAYSPPESSRITPTQKTACLPGSMGYSGLVTCEQQSDCDNCVEKPQGHPMACVTVTGQNQMLTPESLNSKTQDPTLFHPVEIDLFRPSAGTCSGRGTADADGNCSCESGYTHANQDKTNCDVKQLTVDKPGSVCLPAYANKCDPYTSKTVLSNQGDGSQWSCECKNPGSGLFAQNVEGGTCDVVLACGNNIPQMNAPPGTAAVPMQFLTYDPSETNQEERWKMREVFPNRLTSWDNTQYDSCQVALQSSTVSVDDKRNKGDFTYTVYDRNDLSDPTCKLAVLQSNKCTAMMMRGASASAGDGTEVAYVVRGSGRPGDVEKTRVWPPFPPPVQFGLQHCPDGWNGSGTPSNPCKSPSGQFQVSFFDESGDWNGQYTSLQDMRNVGYSADNETSPPPDAKSCTGDKDCANPSVCHKNVCVYPCTNGECASGDTCTDGLCYSPTCTYEVGLKNTLGVLPWKTVNSDCTSVPQCAENPDTSFYLSSLNYDENSVTGYPPGSNLDCTVNMGTTKDVPTCTCSNCRGCEPCCCGNTNSESTCVACDADTSCTVTGTNCVNGVCCAAGTDSASCQTCESDAECQVSGTTCIKGVCCASAPPKCKACTTVSDCNSGEMCQDNVCCKNRFQGNIQCATDSSPWECGQTKCSTHTDCTGKQNVCGKTGTCCNKSAAATCASATGFRPSAWKGSRDGPPVDENGLPSFFKPAFGTTMESWGAACSCDGWVTTSNGSRVPLLPAYTLPGGREDPSSWWQCVIDPCWSEESQLSRYNPLTQKCECAGGFENQNAETGVGSFSTTMDWEATGQVPTCVRDPCNPSGSRSTLLKGCGAGGGTCDPADSGENVAATCKNNKCYVITTNTCTGPTDVVSCEGSMVGGDTTKNITTCVKTQSGTTKPTCDTSKSCTTDTDCINQGSEVCLNGNCCVTGDKYRCAVLDLSRQNVTCSTDSDCSLGTCLTQFGGPENPGICSGGCVCPSSLGENTECTQDSDCNAGQCITNVGESTGLCIGMYQAKTDANPLQRTCIGPCAFNPCQNGGTCSVGADGKALCSCPPCFKGGINDPYCVEQKQGYGNYCTSDSDCCEGVCRHAFWIFGSKECRNPHWYN